MIVRSRRFAFVKVASLALTAFALVSTAATANCTQMSESERKRRRARPTREGVTLQDQGKPAEALARFEAAQSSSTRRRTSFASPSARCSSASSSKHRRRYETLIRKHLRARPRPTRSSRRSERKAEPYPAPAAHSHATRDGPPPTPRRPCKVSRSPRTARRCRTRSRHRASGQSRHLSRSTPCGEWLARRRRRSMSNVVETRTEERPEIVMVQRAGVMTGAGAVALPPPPRPTRVDPKRPNA